MRIHGLPKSRELLKVIEKETTHVAQSVDSLVLRSLGLGQTGYSTSTKTTLPPSIAKKPKWLS